jgi:hypothetical protein
VYAAVAQIIPIAAVESENFEIKHEIMIAG